MKHARSGILMACALAMTAPAWGGSNLAQPGASDSWLQLRWNARLRHEQVDDAAYSRNARADTLRLRLGLLADFGAGWSGYVEGAGVASAGNHYDSGANGQTRYPAITDPRGGELNQAWVRWQGNQFHAIAGRQELVLDNQRWVGTVGWRQFEQTYDAVALQWQPATDWTLSYDWLDRVHRVSGPDAINRLARARKLDTSLFNVAYSRGLQTWIGYAYLHHDRDVASASTATYGVRWNRRPTPAGNGLGWTVEVARQADYADNPARFRHTYWLLEPSWTHAGLTALLGWEHLGGDGRHALQTPLATLHAFNGWDDRFLGTPVGGLDDRYVAVAGAAASAAGLSSRIGWTLAYHDFHAVHGGRYGSEWDASLGFPLARGLGGLLKIANYRACGFGHDDTKLWLQLEWHGQRDL